MLLREEDERKLMPVRPFGSFRFGSKRACSACHLYSTDRVHIEYGPLCHGKRRFWLIGKRLCPSIPHFHVRCVFCHAAWFESMNESTD